MSLKTFTLGELASILEAELHGNPAISVSGLATLQNASQSELTFLANPSYEKYLSSTKAAAVIINKKFLSDSPCPALVHENPYLAYAKLSHLWDKRQPLLSSEQNIHASVIIGMNSQIEKGAHIEAGVVIGSGVQIKQGVFIGANSVIGDDCVIGDATRIESNVTLYHGVAIGKSCVIHSGVVLGADGFGFAPVGGSWLKIAQLGGVIIEDNVEIGANTTIDRGALDNTVIEKGVILDNQIQVAHNVRIGQNTAIAACSAIAGSTVIGKNCIIGGATGIAGHLTIVDGVHITAMTMVIKSLTEPGVYSSGTGVQPNAKWRKSIARLRQLDKMADRIKQLEMIINKPSDSE